MKTYMTILRYDAKQICMFGLFKKKSEKEKLQEQYKSLLEEAFILSKTNRSASDAKTAEAGEILSKIEQIKD